MTTVLPVPVAILKAMRGKMLAGSSTVSLASRSSLRMCVPAFDFEATSLSQIAVSTASCCAKNSFFQSGLSGF